MATIREFGTLKSPTVFCSAFVTVTANNGGLSLDLLRRTLPVRIIVDTDQPELREFDFDPYEEARADRPALLAAAFTIVKAWWLVRNTAEGRRIRRTKLGSFEDWSDLVAGAVEWLIGINPIALIEERKSADPMRGNERRVMAALSEKFGQASWTAKEAATGLNHDIWEATMTFKGDHPSANQVGAWLGKRKDKVPATCNFVANSTATVSCNGRSGAGFAGFAGFSYSQPCEKRKKIKMIEWGFLSSISFPAGVTRQAMPAKPAHPPQVAQATAARTMTTIQDRPVTAAARTSDAAVAGVTVRLVDGRAKVFGHPTPELLELLRGHKAELVALLARRCLPGVRPPDRVAQARRGPDIR